MSAIDEEAISRIEMIKNIAWRGIPTLDALQSVLFQRQQVCKAIDGLNPTRETLQLLNIQLDHLNNLIKKELFL